MPDLLTATQIRTGRYLLGWGPSRLARKTGLTLSAITRAEGSLPPQTIDQATSNRIRVEMEAAGVAFSGGTEATIRPGAMTRVRRMRTEGRTRYASPKTPDPEEPPPDDA